jgi:hypothetical protein
VVPADHVAVQEDLVVMENNIVDSTPQGSVILAYGSSNRWFQRRGIYINIVICIILLVSLGWTAVTTLRASLPLPSNQLLLIAVKPHAITPRISHDQLRTLPTPWQQALGTQTRFTVMLGVSLDTSNRPRAFAVTPRFLSLPFSHDVRVEDASLFRVIADRHINATSSVPLREILRLGRTLRSHDAAWRLNLPLLARTIGPTNDATLEEIQGTWDGSRGMLRLPTSKNTLPTEDPRGSIFSIIGADGSAQELIMNGLLTQGADLRGLAGNITMLSAIPETGTLHVAWQRPLNTEELRRLTARLGTTADEPYTLPDQTVVPERTIATGTPSELVARPLLIDNTTSSWRLLPTSIQYPDISTSASVVPLSDCPGHLRFLIQERALEQLMTRWNVPDAWKALIQTIQLSERDGVVMVCIES